MITFTPVQPLGPEHRLDGFDCGSPAQTVWLHQHAGQAHQSGSSRVYVAGGSVADRVHGYYALASDSVQPCDAPKRVLRGAGRYAVPVVVLTRLGVDISAQGHGLGRALLVDALRRVNLVAEMVGVRALLIHCEDEAAKGYYTRLAEFEESPTDPLHLVLLMKDLRRVLRTDTST